MCRRGLQGAVHTGATYFWLCSRARPLLWVPQLSAVSGAMALYIVTMGYTACCFTVLEHWMRELNRFGVKAHKIESPLFSLNHTVHIVTVDRAKKREYLKRLKRQQWDLVVIDEAPLLTGRPSLSVLFYTSFFMKDTKDKYEDKIALRSTAQGAVAIEPEECLFVQKNDVIEIDGIERGPYVPSGAEAALLERLSAAADAAKSGVGTVVLLLGDVGTAKSAAASAALFMLLERRSDVAVLAVDPDYPFDEVAAQQFFTTAKGRGYVPVVYFDAFVTPAYSTYEAYQSYYFYTLNNAVKYAELVQRHGAVGLFVFSHDQIGAATRAREFRSLVGNALLTHDTVDIDVAVENKSAFVKRLVEAYSGMRGEGVDKVVKAVASRRDGYAAVAVWAAIKLREGASAEEALEWAERKYLEFAIRRVWHWLFDPSSDPERYARLFLVVPGPPYTGTWA